MRINYLIAVIVVIFAILALKGCGSGGGGENGNGSNGSEENPPEASATIGQSGGTVEVTDSSSPLYGVKIEIPAGAVDNDITITIKQANNELPIPDTAVKVSKIVSLDAKVSIFNEPLTITIPYDDTNVLDESVLQVYAYNDSTWQGVTFKERDTEANTLTVFTIHFSDYAVFEPQDTQDSGILTTSPPFKLPDNAFPINDSGTWVLPSSRCAGMVSYAKWFFENNKGDLLDYDYNRAQEVATEAQDIIPAKVKVPGFLYKVVSASDKDVAEQMISNLKNNKLPILGIFEYKWNPLFGKPAYNNRAHAVLVYAYKYGKDGKGSFYVYDPTDHLNEKEIKFDGKKLGGYRLSDEPLTSPMYAVITSPIYKPLLMNTVSLSGVWKAILNITGGDDAGKTERGNIVIRGGIASSSIVHPYKWKKGSCRTNVKGSILGNTLNMTTNNDYWSWWSDNDGDGIIEPGDGDSYGECCSGNSTLTITFSSDSKGSGQFQSYSCTPYGGYRKGNITLSR